MIARGIFMILMLGALHVDAQSPYIQILGIAQDAGYPQLSCKKSCCAQLLKDSQKGERVACVAIVLPEEKQYFLIDATPDIISQVAGMQTAGLELKGIFLTHAHIGHYTGLMYLGREAMGANKIPIFCMPKMEDFLRSNGPWSQLVELENILIHPLINQQEVTLSERIKITPFTVPHRDEFSETVGYKIKSEHKEGWYIPDIDKWEKWDRDLRRENNCNFLLVDGTFYQNGEIWGRDMSEIPHPFIVESIDFFSKNRFHKKTKVVFTHFNHTNPAMRDEEVQDNIRAQGFHLAKNGDVIGL